jgi:hypothetical protein
VIDAMGQDKADKMMRLFLLPGLYHCFGGDGLSQFDIISPLMAWVEAGQAPTRCWPARSTCPTSRWARPRPERGRAGRPR